MWRSLFLAIGIYLAILGGEFLMVDKAVLRIHDDPPTTASFFGGPDQVGPNKTITPPPWAPWTLIGAGIVTCIYSFTIPRRVSG